MQETAAEGIVPFRQRLERTLLTIICIYAKTCIGKHAQMLKQTGNKDGLKLLHINMVTPWLRDHLSLCQQHSPWGQHNVNNRLRHV